MFLALDQGRERRGDEAVGDGMNTAVCKVTVAMRTCKKSSGGEMCVRREHTRALAGNGHTIPATLARVETMSSYARNDQRARGQNGRLAERASVALRAAALPHRRHATLGAGEGRVGSRSRKSGAGCGREEGVTVRVQLADY